MQKGKILKGVISLKKLLASFKQKQTLLCEYCQGRVFIPIRINRLYEVLKNDYYLYDYAI